MRKKFVTSIDERLINKIRDKAYESRKQENEIVETALELYFDKDVVFKYLRETYEKEMLKYKEEVDAILDQCDTIYDNDPFFVMLSPAYNDKDKARMMRVYEHFLIAKSKVELIDVIKTQQGK